MRSRVTRPAKYFKILESGLQISLTVLRPVKSSKRLPGHGHVFIEQPKLLWMPSVSKAFVSLSCVKETLPVWNVFHKTEHVKGTGS